ncbi:NAD(P)-dependent oxidoreductase [Onishia taeanensis]
MSEFRRVGLIGVGLMGHGIARNLLRHGHALHFLDHPGNQPVEDLVVDGAVRHSSGAEVAAATEVVILCVTGSPQVEAVLCEPDGVLEGLTPGTTVIDCSTAIPSATVALAERVEARGGRFCDAAMTRTPKEAEEGRLNLIVGAPPALYAEIRPLLTSFAETISHVGPVGSGHRVKLLHNFVSLGFSAVLAEAAAAARRADVAPEALVEVLGNGGGAGVVLERLSPFILADDASGFRFSLSNADKDIGYYRQMVEELGGSHQAADGIAGLYRQAIDQGHGQATVPELVALLAEASR